MVMATVFWLDYMMSRREGLNKLAGAALCLVKCSKCSCCAKCSKCDAVISVELQKGFSSFGYSLLLTLMYRKTKSLLLFVDIGIPY